MKLASGFINVLNSRFPAVPRRLFIYTRCQRVTHLVIYFIPFTGLIVLSQLLTEVQSQETVNIMCWVIVCAVAVLALMSVIKVLEGVLDS